jgi:hypothetical protein
MAGNNIEDIVFGLKTEEVRPVYTLLDRSLC